MLRSVPPMFVLLAACAQPGPAPMRSPSQTAAASPELSPAGEPPATVEQYDSLLARVPPVHDDPAIMILSGRD